MRNLLGIISLVLVVGGLTACGSSDPSPTTTESSTTTTTSPQSGSSQTGPKTQSSAQGEGGQGGQSSKSDSEPHNAATPLKVSGDGSAQFRAKGGDNSIQDFGQESDEAELQAAAEAVHDFYVARAEEDWGRACTYLATSMVTQLKALASQSPQLRNKGCAPALNTFTRRLPASVRRETTVVDARSLRREDDQGFLIYYGAGKTAYAIPLKDEEGAWKLTLLAPTPVG